MGAFLKSFSGDVSLNPDPDLGLFIGCFLNFRSIRNKLNAFVNYVNIKKFDVTYITETWFRTDDTYNFINSVTSLCYNCTHTLGRDGLCFK